VRGAGGIFRRGILPLRKTPHIPVRRPAGLVRRLRRFGGARRSRATATATATATAGALAGPVLNDDSAWCDPRLRERSSTAALQCAPCRSPHRLEEVRLPLRPARRADRAG